MPSLRPRNRDSDTTGFLPILLANLLPLAGVVWAGWEPATLAVVYGLEVLLSLLLAGGTALFAQRPPPADREGGVFSVSEAPLTEKRGSVDLVDALPPIHVRNVPFTLAVLFATVGYSFFLGVALYATLEGDGGLTEPTVIASVGALFVGQLLETRRTYFGRRRYERVSPYAVIETPAREVFVLLFALVTLGVAFGSTGILVLIVCVKLLVEWSAFRATRADADTNRFVDRFAGWFAGPTDDADPLDPVRAPPGPPQARVRPSRRAVAVTGLFLASWKTAVYLPFVGVVWFAAVFLLVSWVDSVIVFWLGVVGFLGLLCSLLAVQVGRHFLAYGTLEYQRRGDTLVAYDRLLEEPQWTASIDGLRSATLVQDRLADRLFGTRTIRVTSGWGATEADRSLESLAEPDRAVDAFELPFATTELEALDRRLATVAVALAVGIVLSPVAFVVVPGLPAGTSVKALIFVPFAMIVPWTLWKRACEPGA